MATVLFHLAQYVDLSVLHTISQTVPYSTHCFTESYMLAFAESNRRMDFVRFLELLDPRKLAVSKYISSIFKYMGRFELENYAEKLLQEMTSKGDKLYTVCSKFNQIILMKLR